jgi:acylphosphatase
MMAIARRAVISGRVQGVGFRFFAERAAREAGIRGWVRNLPDGNVETVAEGEEEAVARYLDRLRRGPIGARVTGMTAEDVPAGDFPSFEITR